MTIGMATFFLPVLRPTTSPSPSPSPLKHRAQLAQLAQWDNASADQNRKRITSIEL